MSSRVLRQTIKKPIVIPFTTAAALSAPKYCFDEHDRFRVMLNQQQHQQKQQQMEQEKRDDDPVVPSSLPTPSSAPNAHAVCPQPPTTTHKCEYCATRTGGAPFVRALLKDIDILSNDDELRKAPARIHTKVFIGTHDSFFYTLEIGNPLSRIPRTRPIESNNNNNDIVNNEVDNHDNDGASDRERWEKMRAEYSLHASSMNSILGHNYFQKPQDMVRARVDELHTLHMYRNESDPRAGLRELRSRRDESFRKNHHIARGNRLEPVAKLLFQQTTGHALVPLNDRLIFSNADVFGGSLGATPDGITYCGAVLEVKCPSRKPSAANGVRMYNDQVQSYMAVLGSNIAYLYQYHETAAPLSTFVERNADWARNAQPLVDEFFENVDREFRTRTEVGCRMSGVDVDNNPDDNVNNNNNNNTTTL